ncbi:MAG TPA: ubiquinol-cytochrome c reductase iron-sulfur subunit [Bryobacteraceae bacterium]|nr:ubiquinol-cytochrome c reductase iron-sulfur subunit [Bryobacteraceae bacterium]
METLTRRTFYSAVIAGLGGIMTAALAAPAAAYLFIRPKSQKQSDFVPAADLSQLTVGKPEEVVFRRTRTDGWRVVNEKSTAWVLRKDEQTAVAYTPQCTHLGCAYHWDEKENNFLCPCHTSTFSIDGKVLTGPAPRPLDRYVTRIEQGKILIGTEIQKS